MESLESKQMNEYVTRYFQSILNPITKDYYGRFKNPSYSEKFERAYFRLPSEYRDIICYEYMFPNEDAKNMWSRSTYYRKKKLALKQFFYEIGRENVRKVTVKN